jgi:hypothetical protein
MDLMRTSNKTFSRCTKTLTALAIAVPLIALSASLEAAGEAKQAKNPKTTNSTDDAKLELGTVVKAIEDALKTSQDNPVAGFPDLQSVKVTVQTTVEKDVDGKVKIFVFNIGGKHGAQQVSSMSFELKPPPKKVQPGVSSVNPEDIKNALAREIQAAKLGFQDAARNATTLKTDTIDVSVGFTVSNQGTGGIDTGSLFPIGITANGTYSRTSGNTIALEFGTPKPISP